MRRAEIGAPQVLLTLGAALLASTGGCPTTPAPAPTTQPTVTDPNVDVGVVEPPAGDGAHETPAQGGLFLHRASLREGLRSPARLALAQDGTILVTDPAGRQVARFDAAGQARPAWVVPGGPLGIALSIDGTRVFVSLRSEHLALRWGDVDWNRGRLTVHATKTEHHEGGGVRQAPLFPELRAVLMEGFAEAAEGAEFVITRYRSPAQNLRTQLQRIIKPAGLTPWPKLWQNLRSTRETELAETFPLHVVCAWIGNSRPVAIKRYLQVTEEHYQRAVQNPVQQVAAGCGTGSQPKPADSEKPEKCRKMRLRAAVCELLEAVSMGQAGLEPALEGF